MLPGSRTAGEVFAIPQFSLGAADVEGFLHELRGFHEAFRDCLARREPREQFFGYMVGQFSTLERKSIEPMALPVGGGNVRAMQRLISDAVWDEGQMRRTYHRLRNDDLGDAEGVLMFDESGFPKKGRESVGVSRQYCGTLGTVENGQVGVFAAYASRHGYAFVDKRLFLPEPWFTEAYAVRRTTGKGPGELTFHTKPQLAVELLRDMHQEAVLPVKYMVADCLYGNSPDFIEAAAQCGGKSYFVSIPSDTRCWVQGPVTHAKRCTSRGETRPKHAVRATAKAPLTVAALAKSIHDCFWYRRQVSEGAKGPIEYEFTKRQVMLSKANLPSKAVWLVMKRTIAEKPTYSYYISNAPVSTRLRVFVWLSGLRWAIEQCFQETKMELGMDHDEIRKYPGWHHHMLTCMLAHCFLWHMKIRLGEKSPSAYGVAAEDVA